MGQLTTRQLQRKRGNRGGRQGQKSGLQPGDTLQDRYSIVGPLGAGGFSSVYQARDMRFPGVTKLCAIKEMVIATSDPQLRELTIKSFEREAGMLAMLDHPTIPDISDYFTEKNRSYLVLELIRGKDLDDWLQDETELLDEATSIEWALQICEALGYLHTQKPQPIVFRDMKPSNIMLDQHKRIRLIDFGIAKLFESEQKGTMIGTEGYSPPEQYRGIATPAGDVYALGATLHHLLTRQDPRLEPPFTFAERPIRKVNSGVSPAYEALINRCLAYNPKERYPDAIALKSAIEALSQPAAAEVVSQVTAVTPGVPQTMPTNPNIVTTGTAYIAPAQIKPLWTFKCEDEVRQKAAIDNGVVYIGAYDNNLYALNQDSGEFLWKFPAQDSIGTAPFIYEDDVFITSSDSHLYSIKKRTGQMNWRFKTGNAIYASPIVRFDHIFFGSDDQNFYAVNAKRGKQVWKANAFSPVRSTAFVGDDLVFFGTEGGYIYSLELSTGKMKWQAQAKRSVTSSPTVADDIVFIGSVDSTVYAIDATSGFTIWRFRSRRPIISSPIVYDRTVYIGSSDGNLYAIDMDTGRQQWAYETEGQIASSPAVWEQSVYVGSTDGKVYSLSTKRGDLQWRFDTGGPVIASPIVVNEVVYIGSSDKILYALPA
jgi:outer membrane protein assembly factor BamB/tRNA A-37 threonylcarbamoyl transferase component Bud32